MRLFLSTSTRAFAPLFCLSVTSGCFMKGTSSQVNESQKLLTASVVNNTSAVPSVDWHALNDKTDTDGDGVPDIEEREKYLTDPSIKDTKGTGVSDGSEEKRREFSYSVKVTMEILKPISIAAMHTEYQDARLLSDNGETVTVEVTLYPYAKTDEKPSSRANIEPNDPRLAPYLAPYPSAAFTTDFRQEVASALAKDIGKPVEFLSQLSQQELVKKAADWLFRVHNQANDTLFIAFLVQFIDGKATIPDIFVPTLKQEMNAAGITSQGEALNRNIFGMEMFRSGKHGSCTPSAILLATTLRALGIPTREILTIPAIDSNDFDQVEMAQKNLTNLEVRSTLVQNALTQGGFTSHTFNEVFVDNRWKKLNYSNLGQGILDKNYFGLMVQINTFLDWSHVNYSETWGRFTQVEPYVSSLKTSNPFRTIAISDHFGKYSDRANPDPTASIGFKQAKVNRVYAIGDSDVPVGTSLGSGDIRFLISVENYIPMIRDFLQLKHFLQKAPRHFELRAAGKPTVAADIAGGTFTNGPGNSGFNLAITSSEYNKMEHNVAYQLVPISNGEANSWLIGNNIVAKKNEITSNPTPPSAPALSKVLITKAIWSSALVPTQLKDAIEASFGKPGFRLLMLLAPSLTAKSNNDFSAFIQDNDLAVSQQQEGGLVLQDTDGKTVSLESQAAPLTMDENGGYILFKVNETGLTTLSRSGPWKLVQLPQGKRHIWDVTDPTVALP